MKALPFAGALFFHGRTSQGFSEEGVKIDTQQQWQEKRVTRQKKVPPA